MANTLTFANLTLTDADIYGGITYTADLNTGEEFSIGNTASASVSFLTDTQLPLYSKDQTNGVFTWAKDSVSCGTYYITEVIKAGGRYTVTAYDAMILLDVNISALSLSFPLSVSAAAAAIAAYLGCTVSGTINNGSLSVDKLDDMSIRQLLGYVAEASGCSVKIAGNSLCFMYYADSQITVTASQYKTLETADYTCSAIDNVTIIDGFGATVATAGAGTNSLFIQDNPFLDAATNTEAQTILSQVSGFVYAPLKCELFEDHGIEIGTMATFGTTATLVMHLESSENGVIAFSVGSDSREEYNKTLDIIAAEAYNTAKNTGQYFWHKGSGADPGVHITEMPKEDFLDDPSNGGGNLLATSQGIAVRDGLTELATFDSEGFDVYKNGTGVAHFGTDIRLGTSATNFTLTANATTGNYSMVCKRANVVKGRLFVSGDVLGLETNGTGTFTQSGNIVLQSEIGSGNTRYGAVDIFSRRANGSEYGIRIAPTGLTASAVAKVLWSGAAYMSGGQSVDLTEAVSEQLNGIVLVWSRYASGTAQNDSWSYDFVPKWHTIYHDGGGVYCSMPTGTKTNTVCNKYVYVYDVSVDGHADNTATGTGYANNTRVLRAVLGV